MIGRLQLRAERSFYRNRIEFFVARERNDGLMEVAKPLQMGVVDADLHLTEPTMALKTDEAQELMDELWRCGLRPTEGSGSAGSLAATERHLADMKAIAMGLLAKKGLIGP